MRIMEEVVRQQNPFTSNGSAISAKMKEQQEIDRLRKEFLKRGGKVSVIESPDYKPKPVNELDENLRDQFDRGRANAHAKSVKEKSRKYIRTYARKSPQVIIGGVYVGSYPDVAAAVIARDQYLIDNNMPPTND